MKSITLKLIAFILLIATLLPMAVACTDEPPPPENPDENGGESGNESGEEINSGSYIKSSFKEYKTLVLTDFNSESFKAVNSNVDTYLETKEDKQGYRYETRFQPVSFTLENPETDLSEYYYITFSIYSEAATNTELSIRIVGWKALLL